jgi:hypothetical protein
MRQHFRFLREFRKELRLRLNAAEDLLLNGAREPTHRGVCQHLLSKVDRARVTWAAQHLPPQEATRLMEGILQIFPDLEYVLLYLECVHSSTTAAQATAALAQGLERIDFSQVSHSQMRRVLDLVVELFTAQQLPELLLGLLEGKTFRRAFDDSAASLPGPLADLVVPLRAVQQVIVRGKLHAYDAEVLERGVNLLLQSGGQPLLRRPSEVRRRLFEFGLAACARAGHPSHRGLELLLGSFPPTGADHAELGILLVRHLLAADAEADARRVLRSLASAQPGLELPKRWLEALDAPRLGRVALHRASGGTARPKGQHRKHAGAWLDNLRAVWVFVAGPDQADRHAETVEILRTLALPSVVVCLGSGLTEQNEPYLVVPHRGHNLEAALERKGGLSLEAALRVCRDGVAILAALAGAGVELPDARARRFDLAPSGRLWLVDLTGARRLDAAHPAEHKARLAREFCGSVLDKARRYLPPQPLRTALEQSAGLPELVRLLELLQGPGTH